MYVFENIQALQSMISVLYKVIWMKCNKLLLVMLFISKYNCHCYYYTVCQAPHFHVDCFIYVGCKVLIVKSAENILGGVSYISKVKFNYFSYTNKLNLILN